MKLIRITRTSYLSDRVLATVTVHNIVDERVSMPVFACAGLSLPWLCNTPRKSCIPAGTYPFRVAHSPARGRAVVWLDNVPGRSAIQVHNGNYPGASLGCEIVGERHADIDGDGRMDVTSSIKALASLIKAVGGNGARGIVEVIGDGRDTLQEGMNGYVRK